MKRKLLALVFVLAFAVTSFAALGVSGASAAPTLTTGVLSPQGTHTVVGPDAACDGAGTAFGHVLVDGPGDITNIETSGIPCP
jgi:hypothetical protein